MILGFKKKKKNWTPSGKITKMENILATEVCLNCSFGFSIVRHTTVVLKKLLASQALFKDIKNALLLV